MDLEFTINDLSDPEARKFSDKTLRNILLDGEIPAKLNAIALIKESRNTLLNPLLIDIIQMEEDPSVRMALFTTICLLGKREDFPVLLDTILMEEVPIAKVTMKMNLEIFIEKHSISIDDVEGYELSSQLDVKIFVNCPKCHTLIRQFPCSICGYGHICGVCFLEINESEHSICPDCHNEFHTAHLLKWLESSPNCPVCKGTQINEIID